MQKKYNESSLKTDEWKTEKDKMLYMNRRIPEFLKRKNWHFKEKPEYSTTTERKNSHNGSCKKKAICPKCNQEDNLTRDWYGNLVCPDCFRRSL